MEQDQISKEEYVAWTESKVTQFIQEKLIEIREDNKEALANGISLAKDTMPTEFFVGYIQGLNEFINTEYEDTETEYEH